MRLLCLISALALAAPATAQVLPERPGRDFEQVLTEFHVGGEPLRDWLGDLDARSCLTDDRDDLVPALEALRRVHMDALGDRSSPRIWRMWNRRLRGCSDDGRRLVETWLDSPARAQREFLCEDGLPPEWQELDGDEYLLESLLWYEARIAGSQAALTGDGERVREVAVMELMEAAEDILERHDATYPADEAYGAGREELEQRLTAMWDELIEPHDLGFRPSIRQPTASSDYRDLTGPPIVPQNGGGLLSFPILDPMDAAELARITDSWRTREHLLLDDVDARREEVRSLRRDLAGTEDPEQLAFLLREAQRADARLECALDGLTRFEEEVRTYDPGNRFMNRLLEQGFRHRRVLSLDGDQAEVQVAREELAQTIAEIPSERLAAARAAGDGGSGSGGAVPGPGRWIAGLPGAAERIAALAAAAAPDRGAARADLPADPGAVAGAPAEGRWVEQRYEGPLPEPAGSWDPGLIAALRDHQPALDAADAAILLQLIELAFTELPDRSAVEGAVWRSLAIPGGLELFGQESRLSELLADGYDAGQQPEIVFVLRLWI